MGETYLECECENPEHKVQLTVSKTEISNGTPVPPAMALSIRINSFYGFWWRLKIALMFLFKRDCDFYDCCLVSSDSVYALEAATIYYRQQEQKYKDLIKPPPTLDFPPPFVPLIKKKTKTKKVKR